MKLALTTVRRPDAAVTAQAEKMASALHLPLMPRDDLSLDAICGQTGADALIIATRQGPTVHTPAGDYFFHPSMATARIRNLNSGKPDHMVTAMDLRPGMTVLDCTLGLATDAIVASYVTGPHGTVIGLESSVAVALIATYGLACFRADDESQTAALRRIEVRHGDYRDALPKFADGAVDIVYFDPMFRQPVQASSNMKPLRFLAEMSTLPVQALVEARRVARRRVVVKDATAGGLLEALEITDIVGGRHASIRFGVVNAWNA